MLHNWLTITILTLNSSLSLQIEHIANVITHGLWIVPAIFAGMQLMWRSDNNTQKWVAIVYGSALTLLFAVSTTFHCVHYCHKNR